MIATRSIDLQRSFRRKEITIKKETKYKCYNCHKIGHLDRECPLKMNTNKRHHAHLAEYEDEEEEEIPRKRQAKEEDVEEYVLFYALSGSVIP